MPLFRHHHKVAAPDCPGAGLPGLPAFAAAQGWAPAGDRPFDGHLEDAAAEINRTLHGAPRSLGAVRRQGLRIGATTFRDAYRGSVAGRAVTVANAWTNIGPEVRQSTGEWYGAAVCAVELPSLLPLLCVQPRRFPPVAQILETPAGPATPRISGTYPGDLRPARARDRRTGSSAQIPGRLGDHHAHNRRQPLSGKGTFDSPDALGCLAGGRRPDVRAEVSRWPRRNGVAVARTRRRRPTGRGGQRLARGWW